MQTHNLDDIYKTERKQAHIHCKKRDKFFRQAANAYDQGDHSNAKYLSSLGHEQNALYAHESEQAADRIFAFWYATFLRYSSGSNKGNPNTKIDLHGLHAPEAIKKLENHIQTLKANLSAQHILLEVITGWGKGKQGSVTTKMQVKQAMLS